MKLQPASRREVARIASGSAVCAAVMVAGFWVLSILGIGTFSYRIFIGAVGGTAVAILNFALMCLMVQSAAGMEDKKQMRMKVQASYNIRLFLQAAWVAVAFFVPWIHLLAAAIPLLFPTAVIYYLQIKGKLITNSQTRPAAPSQPSEETEDEPGPFEV